jgi:hypothetical protein
MSTFGEQRALLFCTKNKKPTPRKRDGLCFFFVLLADTHTHTPPTRITDALIIANTGFAWK